MKLSARDAARFLARPDPAVPGVLIYGTDPMRVALRRKEMIATLIGPEGEAEMRLTRIPGGDLRKDPAQAGDAMRAQGFFPGPRVVLVEEAADTVAPAISAALQDWRQGDGQVVVTAGALTPRSALRKLFESHPKAPAIALYDDPPSREEIEATLSREGVGAVSSDAMGELLALGRDLEPGDFRQLVEKLALYHLGDAAPVTPADVAAVAPVTMEAETDDLLHAVAESRTGEIGPLLQRLEGQGVNPVTLCIAATRHFRALHAAASDPGGPASGISRARPPVPFRSRERMQRQVQAWGQRRLEEAIRLLVDTDLTLRSSQRAPVMAVMERAFLRLSEMNRRR